MEDEYIKGAIREQCVFVCLNNSSPPLCTPTSPSVLSLGSLPLHLIIMPVDYKALRDRYLTLDQGNVWWMVVFPPKISPLHGVHAFLPFFFASPSSSSTSSFPCVCVWLCGGGTWVLCVFVYWVSFVLVTESASFPSSPSPSPYALWFVGGKVQVEYVWISADYGLPLSPSLSSFSPHFLYFSFSSTTFLSNSLIFSPPRSGLFYQYLPNMEVNRRASSGLITKFCLIHSDALQVPHSGLGSSGCVWAPRLELWWFLYWTGEKKNLS